MKSGGRRKGRSRQDRVPEARRKWREVEDIERRYFLCLFTGPWCTRQPPSCVPHSALCPLGPLHLSENHRPLLFLRAELNPHKGSSPAVLDFCIQKEIFSEPTFCVGSGALGTQKGLGWNPLQELVGR